MIDIQSKPPVDARAQNIPRRRDDNQPPRRMITRRDRAAKATSDVPGRMVADVNADRNKAKSTDKGPVQVK